MKLSDLKPRGYHLSDVDPDFRGMEYGEWRRQMEAQRKIDDAARIEEEIITARREAMRRRKYEG